MLAKSFTSIDSRKFMFAKFFNLAHSGKFLFAVRKASSSKVDRTSNGTIDVTYSKLPMTVMFMIVML